MRRVCPPLAALFVALMFAAPAGAQQPAPASMVGQRIRVQTCERAETSVAGGTVCRRVTGELTAVTPDSLAIRLAPDSVSTLSRASLEEFQRSAGVHRGTGRGAQVGGFVGLGMGVLISVGVASDCGDDSCGPYLIGIPLVTTAIGVGIGAALGALNRSEKWMGVPVDEVAIVPTLSRRHAGLALRVAF